MHSTQAVRGSYGAIVNKENILNWVNVEMATYIDAEVSPKFRPEVLPDNSIAIRMIESLILRMFACGSPDTHIRYAGCIRAVVGGREEEFVPRKYGDLAHLSTTEHIYGQRQCQRHAISYHLCQLGLGIFGHRAE